VSFQITPEATEPENQYCNENGDQDITGIRNDYCNQ